jgi:acyl-CoA reductase-like NAD-dependent aldehyde dehydrogenase
MGGKNAVIVTQNAELDETVSGIVYSALAHAGQKCSAASRILVDNELKDVLISKINLSPLKKTYVVASLFYCSVFPTFC